MAGRNNVVAHLRHHFLSKLADVLLADRILQHCSHLQLSRVSIREARILAHILLKRLYSWEDLHAREKEWLVPVAVFRDTTKSIYAVTT